MGKFAKELQSQLVPEWQEKYCDYAELKSDLKRIHQHRTMGATYTRSGKSLGLLQSVASMKPARRAASFTKTLTLTISHAISPRRPDYMPSSSYKALQNDTMIVVNKIRAENGETYVTELQEPLSRSPLDRTFFAHLDAQLTKVNKFYEEKEAENIARAGDLEKQILAWINSQEAIADPKELSGELPLTREGMERSKSFLVRAAESANCDDEDETDDAIQNYTEETQSKSKLISGHREHYHIKRESAASVKLRSAMKSVPGTVEAEKKVVEFVPREDDNENQKTYSQRKLDKAKKMLQRAIVDFYRSLNFLSSFRSVNITAFAKITKKYDKVTGWHLAPIYMKEVEYSSFVISKKIHELAIKVEDMYTKHFADGERKKAMIQLRPVRRQGTHWITFFLGLFTGWSIALFISFFILVSNPLALDRGGGMAYLDTVFPVLSTLILVALHLYMYAFNVFAWHRTRINYPFIFLFSPGTELRHREVLLLSTAFTTFLLGGMNIHIAVRLFTHPGPVPPGVVASPSASQGSTRIDVIPLILVLTTIVGTFLPINIIYRSSRFFFLNRFRRLVLAPCYKVELPDFFLGDQLTSQLLVFRNLEFIVCYYASGYFLTQSDQECKKNYVYQGFGYVMVLFPYWWRFLQCLRRYYDEGDRVQLEGAARFMSVFVAVAVRQAYSNYRQWPRYELPLRVLYIVASVLTTSIANYWDICHDWSLLNSKSKNKWLRDKLILKHKSLYFIAMGSNTVLRIAWMASLLKFQVSYGFNQNAFDVIVASLEVLRRGIWNFFRIENEHLTNVGKYRAELPVPLPFDDHL